MNAWNWQRCIFRNGNKCGADVLDDDACHYPTVYGMTSTCECAMHKLARLESGPVQKMKRVLTSTGDCVSH